MLGPSARPSKAEFFNDIKYTIKSVNDYTKEEAAAALRGSCFMIHGSFIKQ